MNVPLEKNSVNPSRLFVKITRDTLPQVKDKYPFIISGDGWIADNLKGNIRLIR